MIKVALPGINEFLEEVLVEENLSEKGEKIRRDFVNIFDNLESKTRAGEIFTPLNKDQQSSHHSPETRTERSTGDDLQGYIEDNTARWSEETAVIEEKVFICLSGFFLRLFTN